MPYKTSLYLYLRPIEALKPFYVVGCAKQMVKKGWFRSTQEALNYLNHVQKVSPWKFKGIMSSYITFLNSSSDYSNVNPVEDRLTLVNRYKSSATNYYGEDPHMWYA